MRLIGFSTGALAFGDFRRALHLLSNTGVRAVELSALRASELSTLMAGISELDLSGYTYVSVHAPSHLHNMEERDVAAALRPCIDLEWPIILHPDAIRDHACWRDFGELVCIENMDKRKVTGRTVDELAPHFAALPEATLCLDLGHARQVDPTMTVARQIVAEYGCRLTQLHLSEVDASCRHQPLSMGSVWAIQEIALGLPACPVILESVVPPEGIDTELEIAAKCFETAEGARTVTPVGLGIRGRS